jgi:FSR family fosmidomycin resistance protein-like MFS transporter
MSGHICVDAVQGGLSAVLPFLVLWNGYSYLQITSLILAANIASAIIQPLFGWLGDKVAAPWLMAVGVLLAGIGICGVGFASSYAVVVVFALVSGIGNAMLHPEGGRLANLVGGARRAETMSVFSVGGQIGFCVGPIITVAAIGAFGLAGLGIYLVLCIPVALILLVKTPVFQRLGVAYSIELEQASQKTANSVGVQASSERGAQDRWGAFFTILGALSIRSVVFYGVTALVPLYLVTCFGISEDSGSLVITAFAAAGAVATLLSGKAAKRMETPKLMVLCFLVLCVAALVMCISPVISLVIVAVMVVAVAINLFNPAAITLSQDYVPAHLGMASGLSFGVAVCVGGVASPFLGILADACGVGLAIWVLAGVSLVGLGISIAVSKLKKPGM